MGVSECTQVYPLTMQHTIGNTAHTVLCTHGVNEAEGISLNAECQELVPNGY